MKLFRSSAIPALAFSFAVSVEAPSAAQGTLYVDDDAPIGGDGLSWATALPDLRGTLVLAGAMSEISWTIRVAQGTYYPDQGTGNRDETFQLVPDVTVQGGYRGLGGGGDPDDRDIQAFPTILSGDIGVRSDTSDNCFHVLTGNFSDDPAALDGVTISDGNANGGTGRTSGAGVLNPHGALHFVGCTLINNVAVDYGGALYSTGESLSFDECEISNNSAGQRGGAIAVASVGIGVSVSCSTVSNNDSRDGGALHINNRRGDGVQLTDSAFSCNTALEQGGAVLAGATTTTVSGCSFDGNTSGTSGGGLRITQGLLSLSGSSFSNNSAGTDAGAVFADGSTISDCSFVQNSALDEGGGIHGSSVSIVDCSFDDNTAAFGGAVNGGGITIQDSTFLGCSASSGGAAMLRSDHFLTRCTFSANAASGSGGAVRTSGDSTISFFAQCSFVSNTASCDGGAAFIENVTLTTFRDCVIESNTASQNGGGIYLEGDATIAATNCVIAMNQTGLNGGGVYLNSGSEAVLINCSTSMNVAGVTGGALYAFQAPMTVANCILWGDAPQEIVDINLLATVTYSDVMGGWPGTGNIDVDPLYVSTDLRVQELPPSPVCDAGSNTVVPSDVATDFAGRPRFRDIPRIPDTGIGPRPVVDIGAHEVRLLQSPRGER